MSTGTLIRSCTLRERSVPSVAWTKWPCKNDVYDIFVELEMLETGLEKLSFVSVEELGVDELCFGKLNLAE